MAENFEEIYLWVEKYRPRTLEDMVLPEDYRMIFQKFINEKEVPHLLLYGPPGSGKTAISRILIGSILKDKMDCLEIPGSAETGVDTVRNLIADFLKSGTFGGSKIKIVFIDEFDYMSPSALAALRNITQIYQNSGRFIFTCNYLYKIPAPLQSRCQAFEFRKSTREFVRDYCFGILKDESIEFDEISVDKVMSVFYPDIRKIINTIQSRCVHGKLHIRGEDIASKEKLFRSYITELLEGIDKGNSQTINIAVQKAIKFFGENELDYRQVYQELFYDQNVPIWAKVIINQYTNSHLTAMIPSMHMMAMIYTITKAGKQLREMRK